jgi:SP family xylose:H+ symportor-like MFS transporter
MSTLSEMMPATGGKGSMSFTVRVCLVATLGGLLFGYDTAVISGAIGFMKAHFDFTAAQKGWAASSALVGCIFGAIMAGSLSDGLGRKKVLIISAILFLISAIGSAIPKELTEFFFTGYPLFGEGYKLGLPESSVYPLFVDYRILGGLAVGAASMTSPMYIAEIAPARVRGRLVSVNQFAIIFGMLVVYFVNYFIAGGSIDQFWAQMVGLYHGLFGGQAAVAPTTASASAIAAAAATEAWNQSIGWRWMFGSEAIPATGLLVLMFLVPETPRFLAAKGRKKEAMDVLTRVNGPVQAEKEMREIEYVLAQETGSLGMLFRPGLKVVLVIGVALAILQQVTGINVFLYYAPEIFKKTGIGTEAALFNTVVVGAVNMLFTLIAIWTVDKLGRKPLMIVGSLGMGVCLAAMGLAAYYGKTQLWILAFMLGYIACFALSVGPVTWVILSEIFPTKVRGRAMAIATMCLWTANYIVSQTFPMMDENKFLVDKFNHGFPFFVYAVFCLVTVVLVWRWVPETKGRSLEQIEEHWTRK